LPLSSQVCGKSFLEKSHLTKEKPNEKKKDKARSFKGKSCCG
jgi:hypothetical protein